MSDSPRSPEEVLAWLARLQLDVVVEEPTLTDRYGGTYTYKKQWLRMGETKIACFPCTKRGNLLRDAFIEDLAGVTPEEAALIANWQGPRQQGAAT